MLSSKLEEGIMMKTYELIKTHLERLKQPPIEEVDENSS